MQEGIVDGLIGLLPYLEIRTEKLSLLQKCFLFFLSAGIDNCTTLSSCLLYLLFTSFLFISEVSLDYILLQHWHLTIVLMFCWTAVWRSLAINCKLLKMYWLPVSYSRPWLFYLYMIPISDERLNAMFFFQELMPYPFPQLHILYLTRF